jgi:WS/DGAT/MGAT family acyltransferase
LGAPSTFETPVGGSRSVAFAQLSLREVWALKEQFGVTLNDVVLAICSGALRTHLATHDEEVDSPLVAVVPISVRGQSRDDDLGNRLSAMFVPLANDLAKPLQRLRVIASTSACAKAQEKAVGYGPMASAVAEAVPPALAKPVIRLGIQFGALRRLRAGNLMISNVPGPNFSLYFAGMRMLAAYPLGPVVDGVALNITVQTYGEAVFVGINACATAVPDLPALATAIEAELGQLTEAAAREKAAASRAASAAVHPSRGSRRGSPSPGRRSPVAVLLGEAS